LKYIFGYLILHSKLSMASVQIHGKDLNSRKRKNIETKFDNDDLVQTNTQAVETISFNVKSATDSNKHYQVSIINGIDDSTGTHGLNFSCTCGDQWNIRPRRNNCKHVGGVLGSLLKTYVKNHTNSSKQKQKKITAGSNAQHKAEDDDDELDIDTVIDQFKALMN
jgi:hypothetical protein